MPQSGSTFGVILRLDFYAEDELSQIIIRSAKLLEISINKDAAIEIATRSRGTPRIANQYVKRVRDFAEVEGSGNIDIEITETALASLHVDKNGLNRMDKRILECIIDKFNGGPVGLTTIATAVAEESDTIEEVIEPKFWRPIDIEYQKGDDTKFRELTGFKEEYDMRTTLKDLLDYWLRKID